MTEDFVLVYNQSETLVITLAVDKKGNIIAPIYNILGEIECFTGYDCSEIDFENICLYKAFMKIEPPKDDYKLVKIKKEV